MLVYTVHEPARPAKSPDERAEEVIFVKEGFTWWGFFFAPFWLLANSLWLEFAIGFVLLAGLAAGLTATGLKNEANIVLDLLPALIVGFEGHGLKRWNLERKGYRFIAPVAGENYNECERRFFAAWLPTLASPGVKPASIPPLDSAPGSWGDWTGPGAIGTLPGSIA